ncbi:hypothetical protein D3C72_1616100 [compost metagenome]
MGDAGRPASPAAARPRHPRSHGIQPPCAARLRGAGGGQRRPGACASAGQCPAAGRGGAGASRPGQARADDPCRRGQSPEPDPDHRAAADPWLPADRRRQWQAGTGGTGNHARRRGADRYPYAGDGRPPAAGRGAHATSRRAGAGLQRVDAQRVVRGLEPARLLRIRCQAGVAAGLASVSARRGGAGLPWLQFAGRGRRPGGSPRPF